ncbi:hypothetical protein E6C27_scaffold675G00460 [Cucumis melo var. makuwa]|uniref:Uncharacterized protein n=1 Tax=Cucumis melo var. makuwa TaxID=1194695 RepID=A0A5A7U8Y3_CUCMM|nr:hypothetical protein E6C27_scaffold675G00460 [Cucumis melo var. makuwa]
MAASFTKLPLALLFCIFILASSVMARPVTVAAAAPEGDISLFPCKSFVPKATECVIDVLKNAVAPHPSCCQAISELHDCSSQFLKDIPSVDMILVKSICALWGVSIS